MSICCSPGKALTDRKPGAWWMEKICPQRQAEEAGRGCRTAASVLTYIEDQTAQGTDQLQGQDSQNQLKVQLAGLREGVLHTEEEEQGCV